MTNEQNQETSKPTRTKTILTPYDYCALLKIVEEQGRKLYGEQYRIEDIDRPPILKMLCYFLQDENVAAHGGIDLNKGLLLTGPIGCGKTAIMHVMCSLVEGLGRPAIVSCRDLSYEFSQKGYEVVGKYSKQSFYRNTHLPFQP